MSRPLTFAGEDLCSGYWHNRDGLQYFPRPKRWRGQTRSFLTSSRDIRFRPALCRITSYSLRFERDKLQFFKCTLISSRHSYKKTVSVRPRDEPQVITPILDKEQTSAMVDRLQSRPTFKCNCNLKTPLTRPLESAAIVTKYNEMQHTLKACGQQFELN